MQLLGHRNIKNTLVYTQLIQIEKDDQFTCKIARTPSEIQELIEFGFEWVCDKDDLKFFKKRK